MRSFLLAIALLIFPYAALASQAAVVTAKVAVVHQYPNATSPEIGSLEHGAKIRISSELTHDFRHVYWYKVQMPSGEFGYVRVTDVKGEEAGQEMLNAGMAPSK